MFIFVIFFYLLLLYSVCFSNMGVRIFENGALSKSAQNHCLVGKMGIYECGYVRLTFFTCTQINGPSYTIRNIYETMFWEELLPYFPLM
jgi:hypothetical protein